MNCHSPFLHPFGVINMMDLYLKFRIIGWIIRLGILAIAVLVVVAYGIYIVKNR